MFVSRDVIFDECKFGKLQHEESMNDTDTVVINDLPSDACMSPDERDYLEVADGEQEGSAVEESDSDDMHSFEDEDFPTVNNGARKSQRVVVPPAWHNDYEVDITAFALSAEEFVEEIPSDVKVLKTRSDWPMWK